MARWWAGPRRPCRWGMGQPTPSDRAMSDDQGRFIWYELMTPDVEGAKAFYGAVVGWTAQAMPMGDGPAYTLRSGNVGRSGPLHLVRADDPGRGGGESLLWRGGGLDRAGHADGGWASLHH